jgi:hypothetical protein
VGEKQAGRVAQAEECLPSKHEALSSNSSVTALAKNSTNKHTKQKGKEKASMYVFG